MGRFDASLLRYLSSEDMRVLTATEMGMKNHECVPSALIASLSNISQACCSKRLRDLAQRRLLAYERGKRYDGYRLTNLGYDYLALKALSMRDSVTYIGNQIGVGKESDVYLGQDANNEEIVLKFHHLGRTSFRKLKEKRDYHQRRHKCSWIYLSRLAAVKEHAFMKALHDRDFPVPRPIDINRHCLAMERVCGLPLSQVSRVPDPASLYNDLMELILRLGGHGLIHSDFNEFNLLLTDEGRLVMIDFPQMVSISHTNAREYFDRDVRCVRDFFRRRFHFEGESAPSFDDIVREFDMDIEVSASGFTKEMAIDLEEGLETNISNGSDVEEPNDSAEIKENNHNSNENKKEAEACGGTTETSGRLDVWLNDAVSRLEMTEIGSTDPNEIDVKKPEDLGDMSREVPSEWSVGSTIPPEVIRQKLKREKWRQLQKNRWKVKTGGGAGRKENNNVVREYAGWDDF